MPKIPIKSTLEFYNYGEQNLFKSVNGVAYSVKVSDKEGNIITLEKDGSLFAMVGLGLSNGVLSLIDKAHNDSILAEVEFPNAGHIDNCHFDPDENKIVFDIVTLNGNVETVELDVESLVDIYEEGQGIKIGDKNPESGKKPISIKLASGEEILQLSDDGLSVSDKITTEDELESALSGKADTEYVDELFGSISGCCEDVSSLEDEIEKIKNIIGTDVDDPNLDERINEKADADDLASLSDEVGDLEILINKISGGVTNISGDVITISGDIITINENLSSYTENFEEIYNNITIISGDVQDLSGKVDTLSGEVENNKTEIVKITDGLGSNVKEAYELRNKNGDVLGDRINIYNDSTLENIEYVTIDDRGVPGQYLKITYVTEDGGRRVSYVDLSGMIIESEFADGLQVIDGKVSVKIDPESDGYLTVSENGVKLSGVAAFLQSLVDVNNQQWEAIAQNRSELENVDAQLWSAIADEISARTDADNELRNLINTEKAERESADTAIVNLIDEKITIEQQRADAAIESAVTAERLAREAADDDLRDLIDAERDRAQNVEQFLNDKINIVSGNVNSLALDLEAERDARINKDNELADEIGTFRELYAKKEYVDAKDLEWAVSATTSAITLANQYSDIKNDYLEQALKLYCDSGHTELQNAISNNSTKTNVISNLRGVSGDDSSHYDDSGNGILDVLHREFHEHVKHDGIIEDIQYDGTNLIIIYRTAEGDIRTTIIPISDLIDLTDYYKKSETYSRSEVDGLVSSETDRATAAEEALDYKIEHSDINCGEYA